MDVNYVEVVIEMPTGVPYKYEVEKGTGALILDRVLNQPVPFNYGYIPDTLAADGDPDDIFVIADMSIYPLTRVSAQLVGRFQCLDQGIQDDKYVGVLIGQTFSKDDIDDIREYLRTYKEGFQVLGFEYYSDERQ